MSNKTSYFRPNIFGVPLSQPFRSVVWLLLQKHYDFRVRLTIPGTVDQNGTLNRTFKAKTGVTTIPVLQLHENLYIPECCAIMKYMCELNQWNDFYPAVGTSTPTKLVLVDAYLHWHHNNTRMLRFCIGQYLRPDLQKETGDFGGKNPNWERFRPTLQTLNDFWLRHAWIGSDRVTIADLVAYEEVVQLTITGLINDTGLVGSDGTWDVVFPNVYAWVKRMEQLPFHEEVHASLRALGPLHPRRIPEMPQVVVSASKVGLKAMRQAQESYSNSYSKL